MALFKRRVIDTEKEIELIATMLDFITEGLEEESMARSYGPKEARASINKKSEDIELKFDIGSYKECVDKELFRSALAVKNALRDELFAWVQEDKLTINGNFDAYRVEELIREARSAQYSLQRSIGAFRAEILNSTKRYKACHDGKEPEGKIEDYSIRNSL